MLAPESTMKLKVYGEVKVIGMDDLIEAVHSIKTDRVHPADIQALAVLLARLNKMALRLRRLDLQTPKK